jgi:hypothetical protein
MEVIEIGGDDPRLYGLVAHLVMDEQVVEYNQGYPFRTSAAYRWFVAVDGGATVGFVPARIDGDKAKINNYWVGGDSARIVILSAVEGSRSRREILRFRFDRGATVLRMTGWGSGRRRRRACERNEQPSALGGGGLPGVPAATPCQHASQRAKVKFCGIVKIAA